MSDASPVPATIYHNPRCSKSRAALAILQEAGASITVVEYLKTPPGAAELRQLYALAGIAPRQGLRADAAALLDAALPDEAILDAMAADPSIIERPLVETPRGVVLARPPERVRDIL